MRSLFDLLRSRVAPAVITATGVMLLAAGLLSYTTPASAVDPSASPSPSPSAIAAASPSPSPAASASAAPSPGASPSPSASPSASPGARVATRIVIPALKIDLPIVAPPGGPDAYPLCNVAMYIQELGQPGEGRATYIYAHARTGMFLPLLTQSRINNGKAMIGDLVQVYTSDDQLFLYEITKVLRHQLNLDAAVAATTEQLWLQTSEGPNGTIPKLQLLAMPLSWGPADPADAHPTPHPVVCH